MSAAESPESPESPGAPGAPDAPDESADAERESEVPPTEPAFETLQVHAGARPDPSTGARAVPIYQTSSYVFRDAAHAADTFALTDLETHAYTRLSNPTTAVVEERIAQLEGGTAAVAVGSGQAATTLALLNLARAGDHLVAAASLYGGTRTLLEHTFADLGIEVTFVDDPDDLDAWRAAIRPGTKALFGESVGNPRGNVLDLAAVAEIAHEGGVPFVVDNTVPTPYLLRPFEHGADIVVHSTTKFLGGHGTAIGGIVVDGGTFDFGAHPDRYPGLVAPDPTYHGLSFWERFGADRIAYALRLRVRLLRDLGPAVSPLNSFLLLQGIETLSLRVERHTANAERVAAWLDARPEVLRVDHPSVPTSPWHTAAKRYLPRGAGAVLSVDLAGGLAAGRRFVEELRLFSHLANIGDARSLAIHPASTTHAQLDPEQQAHAGVTPGLVRLSIGLEGVDDLLADLRRGLAGATGAGELADGEVGR
ncbi:O-acetylhomoserine aminocarboxypropyltransferase/cysteine synthase family protein [Embleya sp. NPDC127516]|uniref:O-acetylhomoserine aminocarboxypropyltransferase/cysteine synthase family protein n=1 Tax=Embleya sp. NPDC127516 TaxID=3363990 RepID=UPI0038152621